MYSLNTDQLERVEQTVVNQQVHNPRLRHELIDHLACEIELLLERQVDFEVAMKQALDSFGLGGLAEVERNITLHVNPLFRMNRLQNALLVCLGVALLGLLGKIFGLPGSNEITLLGTGCFAVLLCYLSFRRAADVPLTLSRFLLHAALATLAIAGAFLALVTPWRNELLWIGLALLALALLWLAIRPSEWRSLSQANPRYIQRAVLLPSVLLVLFFGVTGVYHKFVRPAKLSPTTTSTPVK